MIDRVNTNPLFSELPTCHDAVLTLGKLCDQPVNRFRPQLTGYDPVICGFISHGARLAPKVEHVAAPA